jgi:hypothetical protein
VIIPHDYEERVYAGVLGKVIGVYVASLSRGDARAHYQGTG